MTKVSASVLELPIPERGLIALREAVKKAIEEHARQGLPIYVWHDGKVEAIPADQLEAEADRLQAEAMKGLQ